MSEYTGAVHPGGPIAVRELPGLTISKCSVGSMDNNAYLLVSAGDGLLIDAAAEPGRLVELIGAVPVRTIVTTHRHGDHWQALAETASRTGAQLVAQTLDAPSLPVPVTRTVENGDTVDVGSVSLSVIHLRGHTPGAIALRYDDPAGHPHLFTGDSLFPGGPGGTGNPRDFTSLMDDLEARVFDVLPDETWVYPGHGNDTTLGAERPHLAEWRARGW
ncbi:MAG TPA: MBL fold metallo-hydrolase [Mycobacteriales bacterium]|jgi:glyoxylase-like metal-dependent hydrolase (beta-lactamase superfamily II)|nr:MBL fold metallo-hydrolase [Mycobacteriales bacterium]